MTKFQEALLLMAILGSLYSIFVVNRRRYRGEIPLFPMIGGIGEFVTGLSGFVFMVALFFSSQVPWYCPLLGVFCFLVGMFLMSAVLGIVVKQNLLLDSILKVLAIPGLVVLIVCLFKFF